MRDFDSILLHYTKLFIRQSIDREKNFDVTFEPPHWKILRTPLVYAVEEVALISKQPVYKYYNMLNCDAKEGF